MELELFQERLDPLAAGRVLTDAGGAESAARWHFLYLRPLPQGQGSLRPMVNGGGLQLRVE